MKVLPTWRWSSKEPFPPGCFFNLFQDILGVQRSWERWAGYSSFYLGYKYKDLTPRVEYIKLLR